VNAPTFAIRTERLGKKYRIGGEREPYRTLRESVTGLLRGSRRRRADAHVWALRDVSIEIMAGEVVGIIGRNGAGKSTLLKMLSRITEPTEGRADLRGRVGSLLEVGTGFHNELTGGENIYLSGAILGMRRAEIQRKFDQIVDFAEVAKFIDTPLKHYSSGMYLRLAFGVAAHLEPSILMVDEVLAVGDMAFQRKCLGKMQEVGDTGQTVLFVSHDLTAISRLAPRTLLLQDGNVRFSGPTEEALRLYAGEQHQQQDIASRLDRTGDGVIRIQQIRFYDSRGRIVTSVGSGEPVTIAISYTTQLGALHYADIALDMRFTDMLGHPVTTFSTRFCRARGESVLIGPSGVLRCRIPSLSLAEEIYSIDLWLAYRGGLADYVSRVQDLRVVTAQFFETGQEPVKRKHGAALIRHEWTASSCGVDQLGASLDASLAR
jgi:lipopolysaccharide transport system ATP-binding protein